MAKFVNPGAAAPPPPAMGAGAVPATGRAGDIMRVEPVLLLYTIGCWAWALCTIAAPANDVMVHLLRGKAYLFYVGYPLALSAFLFCGSAFRGLGTAVGKMWLLFGVWLMLDIPFSMWRGGSWDVVKPFLTRNLIMFFLICSFAVNLRYVKFLLHTMIVAALLVLATCFVWGRELDGRFLIPASSYYRSANDLGIELLVNIGFLAFLLSRKQILLRVLGGVMIVLSVYFMLRTGSRGSFVAGVIVLVVSFVLTKNKMKMALLLIPMGLIVPLVNRTALERLAMIYLKPETAKVETDEEGGAIISQMSRQQLLRRSLALTAKHPLFGVGPGQFIDATSGADQRRGMHSPALGTHNSYTQISSECGLIAFFCFAGAIFSSFRKVWVLYKRTRGHPEVKEIADMAYSLLLALTGFSAVALFHHVGYSGYPLQLTGMAVALSLAAEDTVAKLTPTRWTAAVSAPAPPRPLPSRVSAR